MSEGALTPLAAWGSFYVIVGSSAAALTGLQFVVIAIVAETRTRSSLRELDAFATPTMAHFCAVLLVSAILSAPWREVQSAALALSACGVTGVVYGLIVVRRARLQTRYTPVLEDWIWHTALPLAAYVCLSLAATMLSRRPTSMLFVVGSATLLLLFIGIHNAWDAVTYIAIGQSEAAPSTSRQPRGE
jgi:hypothetical protein